MRKYLYFSANWCQPCKQLGPIMESVSKQVPVEKIDVDANPKLAQQYSVRSIPTVVLVENNRELKRTVGVNGFQYYIDEYSG